MKSDNTTRGWLAGVAVASMALPPIGQIHIAGGTFSFTAFQVSVVLLAVNVFVDASRNGRRVHCFVFMSFVSVALMVPPVLIAPDKAAAALAFSNFAVGAIGGALIGDEWRRIAHASWSAVDIGAALFLLTAAMQLWLSYDGAPSSSWHQLASTPWGRSNYVAGVLVVVAVALLSRTTVLAPRVIWIAVATIGVGAAMSTYSRGGLVAAAVSLAYLMIVARPSASSQVSRVVGRLWRMGAAAAGAIAAVSVYQRVSSSREAINSQAARNIDVRFDLWRQAWEQTASSPFFGNGWVSMRTVALWGADAQSFAHNLLLSFLQMGGFILGGGVIVIIFSVASRGFRASRRLSAGLVALLAISMTDPFMEGTIGCALFWAIASMATAGDSGRHIGGAETAIAVDGTDELERAHELVAGG